MLPLALFPASIAVRLDGLILDSDSVTLLLRTTSASTCCPDCATPSQHVHSRYNRTIRDLPQQGRATVLCLTARKFFCRNPDCPRSIFCERLPDLLPRYARSTSRLNDSHRAIALALGGEAGSRLAGQLSMPTSADTLLRRIRQKVTEPAITPRVLGVDDWAIRKGQVYGTILVDLERRQVIDLLPGRDGETLRQWLKDHPGIEIISRDRASAYAHAASEAAPDALQVADRWHLLKNAREMLERFFERQRSKIQTVADVLTQTSVPAEKVAEEPKQETVAEQAVEAVQQASHSVAPLGTPTSREQAQQAKRQQRVERYQQARKRHEQGQSIRQIAQEMNLSRGAVRRYLRSEQCPDWRPGQARRSRLDGFCKWIDEQLLAGRDNIAELHRELKTKGYEGSPDSVRRFLTKRLAFLGKKRQRVNAAQPRSPPAPSARTLSFEVLREQKKRKPEEQARVDCLRGIDEEFAEVLTLVEQFIGLVRKEQAVTLKDWLAKAEGSVSGEMRGFAQGIRQDEAAVSAAINEVWSNGQVEGQVNRLKTIKRQMYGRANFELLRLRVMSAG